MPSGERDNLEVACLSQLLSSGRLAKMAAFVATYTGLAGSEGLAWKFAVRLVLGLLGSSVV